MFVVFPSIFQHSWHAFDTRSSLAPCDGEADAVAKYKYDFQLLFHYFAKEFVLLRVRHTRQRHLARMSPYLRFSYLLRSLFPSPSFSLYCNVQNIGRCRRTSKSYESAAAGAEREGEECGRPGRGVKGDASGSGWRVYTRRDKDKTWQSQLSWAKCAEKKWKKKTTQKVATSLLSFVLLLLFVFRLFVFF